MKQLTKEQQEQAVELITHLSKETGNLMNKEYYIDKAKDFLHSMKPKIFVCQDICGTFYYFSKSVLNDNFVISINDAHRFDSIEQANIFISEQSEREYPYYVLIG
jgi:hypothetical protein